MYKILLNIRPENPSDYSAIIKVNNLAFGQLNNIWEIKDSFGAPAKAFMALELKKGELEGAGGIVEYPDEFLEV